MLSLALATYNEEDNLPGSFKEEEVFNALFLMIGGGLFIARIFYVVLNFNDFGFDFFKFILINGYPGLSLFGGFLGAFLTLFLFCLLKKIKYKEIVDYFIPGFLVALSFGKLGSFFSGSELGVKTKFLLAIKYSGFDGMRHLTPLYESLIFFLVAYIAYRIIFEIRKDKLSRGFNFYFLIWSISFVYFVFDKLKVNNLYFAGQSFNFLVFGVLLLTMSFYFVYYFRSLIIDKIVRVKNFLFQYVKIIFKKIRGKSKDKIDGGEKKDIVTDK